MIAAGLVVCYVTPKCKETRSGVRRSTPPCRRKSSGADLALARRVGRGTAQIAPRLDCVWNNEWEFGRVEVAGAASLVRENAVPEGRQVRVPRPDVHAGHGAVAVLLPADVEALVQIPAPLWVRVLAWNAHSVHIYYGASPVRFSILCTHREAPCSL